LIAYTIQRLATGLLTVLAMVTLVFLVFQAIPGDAARMYAGPDASPEAVERIREELGLNLPVHVRYASYMGRLLRGNLGESFITRRPVTTEIRERFPNTIRLSLCAITLAVVLGMTMGLVSAIHEGGVLDIVLTVTALAGISMPSFWLGLLLILTFSVRFGVLPIAGAGTWRHYLMPVVCLSVFNIAFITRMTRSSVLEQLGEDFVRTAQAKGLPQPAVWLVHVLRAALIPITTIVGLQFGYMLGGAVVIETVFAWPGMGRMLVRAVSLRDIPVVQGALLVFAASVVLINLAVDLLYGLIDPRMRRDRR